MDTHRFAPGVSKLTIHRHLGLVRAHHHGMVAGYSCRSKGGRRRGRGAAMRHLRRRPWPRSGRRALVACRPVRPDMAGWHDGSAKVGRVPVVACERGPVSLAAGMCSGPGLWPGLVAAVLTERGRLGVAVGIVRPEVLFCDLGGLLVALSREEEGSGEWTRLTYLGHLVRRSQTGRPACARGRRLRGGPRPLWRRCRRRPKLGLRGLGRAVVSGGGSGRRPGWRAAGGRGSLRRRGGKGHARRRQASSLRAVTSGLLDRRQAGFPLAEAARRARSARSVRPAGSRQRLRGRVALVSGTAGPALLLRSRNGCRRKRRKRRKRGKRGKRRKGRRAHGRRRRDSVRGGAPRRGRVAPGPDHGVVGPPWVRLASQLSHGHFQVTERPALSTHGQCPRDLSRSRGSCLPSATACLGLVGLSECQQAAGIIAG